MSPHRTRVLIAEDHNLIAELCKRELEKEFDVVATVSDGHEMVRAATRLVPDVIVVDIAMPILNGLDAGEQVKEHFPAVKLVYLTMNTDPELALEAFHRGASAYLLKTGAVAELVLALRQVLRGQIYLSPILREPVEQLRWERRKIRPETERLTERQREVLQLLAEGKVMKEIADILGIATRTVAFHKYRLMEVLGVKNNSDLVRYAVKHHVIAA